MTHRHARLLFRVCAMAVGLLALSQASVGGQEPALPAAAEIVARHVAAVGGESAHKAISSIHATGTFEVVAQNISGTIDMYSARPAKMLVRADLAQGRFETGFDGKVGWELNPLSGPALLTGRRLSEISDDAWFDGTLHGPDRVKSMTTVAKADFDRRPAYQVKVTYISGNEVVEYYEIETGLLIGTEASRETSMGVVPTTGILRDYRKFGSLLEATTMSQRTLGMEQVLRMTVFEYDKVAANAFDLPPQIKALIR
jgi:hypothetical protein